MIAALLSESCRIAPLLCVGEDGVERFGPEEERGCRVEARPRERAFAGEPAARTGAGGVTLYCLGEAFPPGSRVTLAGQAYRARAVRRLHGFGLDHLEVEME